MRDWSLGGGKDDEGRKY